MVRMEGWHRTKPRPVEVELSHDFLLYRFFSNFQWRPIVARSGRNSKAHPITQGRRRNDRGEQWRCVGLRAGFCLWVMSSSVMNLLSPVAGIPVKSTLDNTSTVQYAGLMSQLSDKARSVVRDLDPSNDLSFLRVRSKKHEIMVAPEKDFLLIVIQNPTDWIRMQPTTQPGCLSPAVASVVRSF